MSVENRTQVVYRASIAVCLAAAVSCSPEPEHWSYEGAAGPQAWGSLSTEFATCGTGLQQSPIDLGSGSGGVSGALDVLYRGRASEFIHNGHAVQVNVSPDNALMIDGKAWALAQIHFHSPSEHLVDGQALPLEAHFVHRDEAGALAVVGVLFREGAADPGLAALWPMLPRTAGENRPLTAPLSELSLLPGDLSHFRYDGSLTTPPCSEGVQWYVLQSAKSVSSGQLAALAEVTHENARPPQPLNGRLVRAVAQP